MFPRDPFEPRVISWLRNPSVRRTLILSILWLFVLSVLLSFREVLLPFGLAILLAFIIEPFVTTIAQKQIAGREIPRIGAILIIYVMVAIIVYLFGSFTLPQIGREMAKIGTEGADVIAHLQQHVDAGIHRVEKFAAAHEIPIDGPKLRELLTQNTQALSHSLRDNVSKLLAFGGGVVAKVIGGIFGMFLVLMLTAFLSMDKERIEAFAATMVPPEYRGGYETIVKGITIGLAGVVRGQVMICLTNGVLTFVGLWLFGVKFPFVLGALAAVFSLIPIFGSIISTIPIVAIALTQSFALAVIALLWIIGIHLVEANFLNPKIMGDSAHIHPVIVVFALIVGEKTSGLIGALFAVPITSVLLTFFNFLHGRAIETIRPEPEEAAPRADPVRDARSAPTAPATPSEPPEIASGPAPVRASEPPPAPLTPARIDPVQSAMMSSSGPKAE